MRGLSFHGMPLWGLGGWVNPMPSYVSAVDESLTKLISWMQDNIHPVSVIARQFW